MGPGARGPIPSLADALKPRPAPPAPSDREPEPDAHRAPSRRGRKAVTIYLDTAAHRQLRMLALEQSRSVQNLMTEATNDLFQKLGKARIAD